MEHTHIRIHPWVKSKHLNKNKVQQIDPVNNNNKKKIKIYIYQLRMKLTKAQTGKYKTKQN